MTVLSLGPLQDNFEGHLCLHDGHSVRRRPALAGPAAEVIACHLAGGRTAVLPGPSRERIDLTRLLAVTWEPHPIQPAWEDQTDRALRMEGPRLFQAGWLHAAARLRPRLGPVHLQGLQVWRDLAYVLLLRDELHNASCPALLGDFLDDLDGLPGMPQGWPLPRDEQLPLPLIEVAPA